eukprot:g70863.t1
MVGRQSVLKEAVEAAGSADEKKGTNKAGSTDNVPAVMREFFFMTDTAVRMQNGLMASDIKAEDLFRKASDQKVPFFCYAAFIQERLLAEKPQLNPNASPNNLTLTLTLTLNRPK